MEFLEDVQQLNQVSYRGPTEYWQPVPGACLASGHRRRECDLTLAGGEYAQAGLEGSRWRCCYPYKYAVFFSISLISWCGIACERVDRGVFRGKGLS